MIRLALATAALLLAAGPAPAQPAETPGPAPVCDRAHAGVATVRDLARDPSPFLDRCVGVSGIWEGGVLYADSDAYGLSDGMEGWELTEGQRIGAEASAPFAERLEAHGPLRVTVYGVIHTCEAIRTGIASQGGEGLTWANGYCHQAMGPRMIIADVRIERPSRDEQNRLTRQGRR